MSETPGIFLSMRSADLERRRSAVLRAEATALRDETRVLRERTALLADALVAICLKGPDSSRDVPERFYFRAGRLRSAVALLRRRLTRWLVDVGVDPATAADITLACSEACANAIEHPLRPARQAFEVEGRLTDEAVELTVRDFGSWQSAGGDDRRGRGLQMIRELMDTTEIVRGDHETTIVMRRARR